MAGTIAKSVSVVLLLAILPKFSNAKGFTTADKYHDHYQYMKYRSLILIPVMIFPLELVISNSLGYFVHTILHN